MQLLSFPLLLLLLTGCGRPKDGSSFETISVPPTARALLASQTASFALEGTGWTLVLLHGASPIEGTDMTLNFVNGFVSGQAGCNSFQPLIIEPDTSRYEYSATQNGGLTIPGFVITEKDCTTPEGVMQQETVFAEALQNAAAFRVSDERLEIDNAAGQTTLVFNREH